MADEDEAAGHMESEDEEEDEDIQDKTTDATNKPKQVVQQLTESAGEDDDAEMEQQSPTIVDNAAIDAGVERQVASSTGMIADEFGALRPVSHSIGGADTEAEEAAELTPTQVLDTSTTGLTTSTSASASQFAQTSHALHNHLAWYVHGMPMFSTLSDASTDMCA